MRAVGIKVLKNKLSEYVRLAAAGETVLVTDRGQVVAELGPPAPGRAGSLEDPRMAEAVRKGWVHPYVRPPGPPLPGIPVMTLEEVLHDLDESRADRV